jgi:hypothetical protein
MSEFIDLILHSAPHRIILMMFLITVVATVAIAILERWVKRKKRQDVDLLIIKARREGKSEYDNFVESAAPWSLSEKQIDEDFKQYLHKGLLPHYVRHALRGDPDLQRERQH